MHADGLKQALQGKCTGMGTGVMGMGCGWREICGDGMGMERTSCVRAAL